MATFKQDVKFRYAEKLDIDVSKEVDVPSAFPNIKDLKVQKTFLEPPPPIYEKEPIPDVGNSYALRVGNEPVRRRKINPFLDKVM